jgi:hypothetical protein
MLAFLNSYFASNSKICLKLKKVTEAVKLDYELFRWIVQTLDPEVDLKIGLDECNFPLPLPHLPRGSILRDQILL